MKLEEIKHELQEQRYFINRISHNGEKVSESLCKKIDGNDYEVLRAVNTPNGLMSAYDLLLTQVNANILDPSVSICSLSEILEVIQGNVFEAYKQREKTIEKHIDWCNCVESEENEYSDGKFIVKKKQPKGFIYFLVDGDKLTEIPGEILDDTQKEKAVRIKYPKLLKKAISDTLENEFSSAYLEEVEKFQSI